MKKLLPILLALYLLTMAALFVFQRQFIFVPYVSCIGGAPQLAAGYQPVTVTAEDGVTVTGWYQKAKAGKPTLLWLHGNADGLKVAADMAAPVAAAGYGIMIVGYRGFNCHVGSPSEQGVYADARAFMHYLLNNGVAEKDVVLFGHSLGTGVATQMATEFKARSLILLAPFLSISKMGQIRFPMFPTYWLVQHRFDNEAKIARINMPLLIAHGDRDLIVPFRHGEQLFALASEPKQFKFLSGNGHADQFAHGFADVMMRWMGAGG